LSYPDQPRYESLYLTTKLRMAGRLTTETVRVRYWTVLAYLLILGVRASSLAVLPLKKLLYQLRQIHMEHPQQNSKSRWTALGPKSAVYCQKPANNRLNCAMAYRMIIDFIHTEGLTRPQNLTDTRECCDSPIWHLKLPRTLSAWMEKCWRISLFTTTGQFMYRQV
jgi:hypothetical protein